MNAEVLSAAAETSADLLMEGSSAASRRAAPSVGRVDALRLVKHEGIDSIVGQWDAFVPRDVAHLRSGMLRAAQLGKVVQDLTPILIYRSDAPAAAALFYTLPIDTVASAPDWVQKLVTWVR